MTRFSTRSKALPSIAVIVVCLAIASTAGIAFRQAKSWGCPCGASAAMVQLTGLTITGYVETWIAWTYILLANNFAAVNAQINGNTQVNTESDSYQTMVKAQVDGNRMGFRQSLASTESPDHKFQATVAAVSGGAEATSYATEQAIMEENIQWLRGFDKTSSGLDTTNASNTMARHLEKYCGDREAELGLCTAAEDALKNAHSRAESVYEYNVLSGPFRDAAIDFCRTLTGVNPKISLKKDMTPQETIVNTNRDTRDARMSLALNTCQHLVALRAEVTDGDVASWAETMRGLISGLEDGVPDYMSDRSPDASGSSFLEILGFAARYRASNPKWVTHTHTLGDPTAVLKQIAAIRATKMMLNWQRYEIQQLNAGLIATLQAEEAEKEYKRNTGQIKMDMDANF